MKMMRTQQDIWNEIENIVVTEITKKKSLKLLEMKTQQSVQQQINFEFGC